MELNKSNGLRLKIYDRHNVNKVLTIMAIKTEQEGKALRNGIFAGHKCQIMYDTRPERNPRMRNHSTILANMGV